MFLNVRLKRLQRIADESRNTKVVPHLQKYQNSRGLIGAEISLFTTHQ